MATKSFTFQVEADPELEAALWEAHVKWNEAMRRTIQYIFKGLRGECGETPEERAGWQKLMIYLKESKIRGKDVLSKCHNPNSTIRPRPHPLDSVWPRIMAAEALIGGSPSEKPVEWMRKIIDTPSWRAIYNEAPLSEEALVVDTNGSAPKKPKKKINSTKKQFSDLETLTIRFSKLSLTFSAIERRFQADGWKFTRESLGKRKMFDADEVAPGFSSAELYRMYNASVESLRSYWELLEAWDREHKRWLNEKKDWEADHREYIDHFKPTLDELWRDAGLGYRRRKRWHKYLEFLRAHPALSAYKGAGDGISLNEPNPEELKQRIQEHRRKFRKVPPTEVEIQALFDLNPGLKELDRVDSEYRMEYLREDRKRKHFDGYGLPPSFTLPDPVAHPRWMEFQRSPDNVSKSNGYTSFSVDGEKGSLLIKLPTQEDGDEWKFIRFKGGERQLRFEKLEQPVTVDGNNYLFRYRQADGKSYLAQPQGMKIFFKNIQRLRQRALRPGVPILSVAFDLVPEEALHLDRDIVCAMDLGIHTPAALTVMHGDKIIAVRIIRDKDLEASTNTTNLRATKRRLSGSRRKSREEGPPIEGHAARFQKHLNDSADDRIKKLVNKVLSFAIAHRAGTLAIEDLSGLRVKSAYLKAFNRSISGWLRGRMVEYLKVQAKAHGITVRELPAYNTSQICHDCGDWGCRYERRSGEPPLIRPVGPLFVCGRTGCLKDYNADVNASFNLHKVHAKRFPKRERLTDEEYKELRETCLDRLTNAVISEKDDLIF